MCARAMIEIVKSVVTSGVDHDTIEDPSRKTVIAFSVVILVLLDFDETKLR